jgi:hypothetical protein
MKIWHNLHHMNLKDHFKKYFVPHDQNDHKPHLLRKESALAILLVILVVEFGMVGQTLLLLNKSGFLAAVLPSVLVSLTNQDRSQMQAQPLVTNALLEQAATLKAQDMAAKGYFAHVTPEGHEPWYWLQKVGYSYQDAGENLAVDFYDSAEVQNAWMNSPTHRANIVKKEYSEIGIATAEGMFQGHHAIFVVQFFGKPKIAAVVASPKAQVAAMASSTEPSASSTELAGTEATGTVASAETSSPKTAAVKPIAKPATPAPKTGTKISIKPAETKLATSSFASTSSQPVVATAATTSTSSHQAVLAATAQRGPEKLEATDAPGGWIEKISISPNLMAKYLLGTLLAVLLVALALLLHKNAHVKHRILFLNGMGLVCLIIATLLVNHVFFSSNIALPQDGQSASVSLH